jgi:glycosyltransferase involved in cell wall biosynthesis
VTLETSRGSVPVQCDSLKVNVLLIGQMPPPYHGQAIANRELSNGTFHGISLSTFALRSSRSVEEVGTLNVWKSWALTRDLLSLARCIKSEDPDVVVFSLGVGGRSALYRDAALLRVVYACQRRLILHTHSAGIDEILTRVTPLERRVAIATYRRAAGLIRLAQGIGQLDMFQDRWSGVLPYGVPDVSPRPPAHRPDEPVVIAFVGNLFASKGVDTLLNAIARLHDEGLPVKAVIVGAATPECSVEQWQARAQGLGLSPTVVEFTGGLTPDEAAVRLSESDIFCFPTRYDREAMPLVILEAMRAALPVVSTRWRAIPEIVEDGVTGYLSDPLDLDGIVQSLRMLITDPPLRRRVGLAARARYLDRHTVGAFREAFEALVLDFHNANAATVPGR